MGTEDFSHIKPVVESSGGAIKPLAQAWGEPVDATDRVGAGHGNIQPAGLFSTAPYVPPETQKLVITCSGRDGACTNTKLDRNGLCAPCRLAAGRARRAADV